MEYPVTYIGFFQEGDYTDENTGNKKSYWNFVPVYKQNGNIYEDCFPNRTFLNGRFELRQTARDFPKPRIIQLGEIAGAKVKTVLKVEFEEKLFTMDKGIYYSRIELPEGMPIEEAIQVKELSLSDIPKAKDAFVALEVDALRPKGITEKKICCLNDYLNRPEIGGLFKNITDVPYAIRSRDKHVISDEVKMNQPDGQKVQLNSGTAVKKVYNSKDVDIISIPISVGQFVVSQEAPNDAEFLDVKYMHLFRPKATAVPVQGRLNWDSEKYYYDLEKTGREQEVSPVGDDPTSRTPPTPPVKPDIVEQIHQYLIDSGRDVSVADVINYCTCITQGFITTFAGAPGTGKTSLCRLLAKAMGLQEKEELENEEDVANYTEVSVERGWTSLKDFIGYPDPFAKAEATEEDDHIIPSNVDVYEAFKRMDNESRTANCGELPLDLMLLDEANLSPIEYYWSQFLRNCQLDDEDEMKKRKIQVSRKKAWLLSPNLRFLATVNFDHTTEELSPRFLDRTWVVTLEPPKNIGENKRPEMPESITMDALKENFGFRRAGETFPAAIKGLWGEICDAFRNEEVNLPLSPRNINAVENYCIAAARFEGITAVQALDLAVLQKILPTISGYGDRYEVLTSALKKIAEENQLEKTARKLKAMMDAAEQNSSFYQFFIR